MDNFFPSLIFTLMGLSSIYSALTTFRDPRRTPALRLLDGCAAVLIGLVLIGAALLSYPPAEKFVGGAVPWAANYLGYAALAAAWLVVKAITWFVRRKQAPESLADTIDRIVYTDLTGSDSALARANRPEPLVRALEGLGCRSVSLVETSTGPGEPNPVSEINEVLASPDGRAFAEPETFFSRDAIALRSMLSDGAIVDTTLLVNHAPGTRFYQRWWVRFNWPRSNRPGAGYFFERMEDTSVEALLARHAERLEKIAGQRGAQIPSHATFAGYVALSRRGMKTTATGKMTDLLVLALAVPTLLMLPMLLIALFRLRGITGILFLIIALPLIIPLSWGAVRLSRWLPLPALDKMSGFVSGVNEFFR